VVISGLYVGRLEPMLQSTQGKWEVKILNYYLSFCLLTFEL
jgi:hypothetical protein